MPLNDKTQNEMASKKPSAEFAHPEALLSGPVSPSLYPVFYHAMKWTTDQEMHIEDKWKCRRIITRIQPPAQDGD